ncbi:MAG: tRNA 2-selenouridine(34) synthase MnmH [Flavobacteriales bacterium]
MLRALGIVDFLAWDAPIIDVRSPGEFARGHIPDATNLPLFTDEERAVVGTLYKQTGRDAAVLEGLRIIGPKMAPIVEQARGIAPEGNIRVHCWRGGERSGSVAWLLDKAGFAEVRTLSRGYKGFRNHVQAEMAKPLELRVLGGYTGSGKTETLMHLRDLGQQVVNLEALAHHKGSSFGAIGELPQPTTEHFENLVWHALRSLDHMNPIWVEDESMMIGRAKIHDDLFAQMREARLFFAEMPIEERATRLVADYGKYPKVELAEAIKRIGKRLGPQHCKTALEALEADDFFMVAIVTLTYYDKTYLHDTSKRHAARVTRLPAAAGDLRGLAERLIAHDGHTHKA